MRPEDLGKFRTPSDPRLHPSGRRVAFTVSAMDLEHDRYVSEIWLWDDGEARPFTRGPGDRFPRWSPDGRHLAFLRRDGDGPAQVAVMPAGGGEASVATDFPLGAVAVEWSPDGSRLAVIGVDWTEEWAGLDEEERARRPRRIRRVPWRFDDRGWVHDRRRHLYLVDPLAGGEEPVLLTPGDFDETAPAWRPDGAAVAFLSARHERRGLDPGTGVFEVAVGGGEAVPLADTGGWDLVTYRPDGTVHLVGDPDPWGWPGVTGIWRRRPDGSLEGLTGHLDRSVHLHGPPAVPGPRWAGDDLIAYLEDAGNVGVVRVTSEGSVEQLLGGDRWVVGFDPSPDGSALAFVATDPSDPGEVWLRAEGEERRLTDLNEEFRKEVPLVIPEAFAVDSDGVRVDAWAHLPPGDDRVPVLLNIHGGPAAQYGNRFFDEFQVYAAAGYGVVACNPRGSSGRGRDFVRAVVGDGWGAVDRADVLAVLDAALERFPRLDARRIGIMGGSYGGFLTAWLIAHEDRFSSAIVERALISWESFSGTSDIGGFFSRLYLDADPADGADRLHEAGPLALAHRITTPTLVLHSESDFRTPIEQGEQLFTALRKAGTEAELVRFPGEGHELSRSGRPRHRRERFEVVLEWHGRHLGRPDMPT